MGILSRMSTVVKSKMNRILDNAENPNETLDYAYEKQMETLRDVKRGVVEMVTAKRRLHSRVEGEGSVVKLEAAQGRQCRGRADLARLALQGSRAPSLESKPDTRLPTRVGAGKAHSGRTRMQAKWQVPHQPRKARRSKTRASQVRMVRHSSDSKSWAMYHCHRSAPRQRRNYADRAGH